jgi:predicted nucleotidyltransferase
MSQDFAKAAQKVMDLMRVVKELVECRKAQEAVVADAVLAVLSVRDLLQLKAPVEAAIEACEDQVLKLLLEEVLAAIEAFDALQP